MWFWMKRLRFVGFSIAAAVILAATISSTARARTPDPLPSWNSGAAKKSITDFVARVTNAGDASFVPAAAEAGLESGLSVRGEIAALCSMSLNYVAVVASGLCSDGFSAFWRKIADGGSRSPRPS
jgi:hypothetical protein